LTDTTENRYVILAYIGCCSERERKRAVADERRMCGVCTVCGERKGGREGIGTCMAPEGREGRERVGESEWG
jgi:hypothetical protein